MTHTPPIPAGNQSPYPLHEAPHARTSDAPPPGDPRIARTPKMESPSLGLFAVGAGLALAAFAGGLFYALRDKPAPKPKRRKRKAAKA